jgi:hypothetical protein
MLHKSSTVRLFIWPMSPINSESFMLECILISYDPNGIPKILYTKAGVMMKLNPFCIVTVLVSVLNWFISQ